MDQLKPSDDIFRQTMVCIKCTEVDEKFLDDTYKAIIEFWDFVVQYNYEKKQRKVQQHLKRIQEQEAQEKENMIPDFIF